MQIFKKLYCRTFQTMFKLALPILPYRQPKIVKTDNDIIDVLHKHKINNVLLVTDKGVYNLGLTKSLETSLQKNNILFSIYNDTIANPTTDNVQSAVNLYNKNYCDAIIAFGGGSAIDCAKAVGAKIARPQKPLLKMKGVMKIMKKIPLLIAIPTTAGTGSETTLSAVITDSQTRHKYAINDFPLIPQYAMLNANLTLGLPKHITSTTGMDALTHAIEAYIGRTTTRQTRKCALFAVKTIFENLEEAYNHPKNFEAREQMLIASYNAGVAFTKSYVGYVHAIAHTLGGKYNIAHGFANAIILPYVLKKYGKSIYKKLWKMGIYAGLFKKNTSLKDGANLFIAKIESMNKAMDIPKNIPDIKTEDIPELAKTAEKEANPLYPVPVLYTKMQLEQILYTVKNGSNL